MLKYRCCFVNKVGDVKITDLCEHPIDINEKA